MVGKINRAGYIDIEFRGEIIKLLQRGEKFEEMYGEFKNMINGYYKGELENVGWFLYRIKKIEKKYFSKEVK